MNIFSGLRQYATKWQVSNSREFTQEERNAVKSAYVVESEYGNSVCFMMKAGGMTFIPLSNDATVGIGEAVDLEKARILTLSKDGETDINRIQI